MFGTGFNLATAPIKGNDSILSNLAHLLNTAAG